MLRRLDEVRRLVRNEAERDWGVTGGLADKILLFPVVASVVVALTRVHRPLYGLLLNEDSVFEWLQFAGYLSAAVLGGAIALRLARSGRLLAAAAYALFAVGCFFVAGEEIAWGQRALGLATPEELAEINKQNEITLHNIGILQTLFSVGQMLLGLYGSVGVWWIALRWRTRPRDMDVAVPPLFLSTAFAIIFGYRLLRFTVLPPPVGYTIFRYAEWPESCLAAALAGFTFLLYRRLRAPAGAQVATGVSGSRPA
jgi:hypothetical protein